MTSENRIKAYVENSSGNRMPLGQDSLILQFPDGNSLEIYWGERHSRDFGPVSAQIWGGKKISSSHSRREEMPKESPIGIAIVPLAANLVRVRPVAQMKVTDDE